MQGGEKKTKNFRTCILRKDLPSRAEHAKPAAFPRSIPSRKIKSLAGQRSPPLRPRPSSRPSQSELAAINPDRLSESRPYTHTHTYFSLWKFFLRNFWLPSWLLLPRSWSNGGSAVAYSRVRVCVVCTHTHSLQIDDLCLNPNQA